jgi:small subunit ribosomal protein S18
MKAIQKSEEEVAKRKEASQETIDPAFIRKFEAGMTYDPFDFSLAKARLDQKMRANAARTDRFKAAGVNPLALWKDPVGLSNFLSPSGNILGSHITGNSRKNQKLLGKAIKRAQRVGLLSRHSKAIEFLSTDAY